MDSVFIENLRGDCLIGVTDEERSHTQKVVVDVTMNIDLSHAAASRRLEDTVDYREARNQISRFISSGEFLLLESLAEGIASLALDSFKVERVVVKVRKEKYSLEPSIGVEVERVRGRRPR